MAVNIAAVRRSFHIGENGPVDADSPASRTALGAARHRAVHQLHRGRIDPRRPARGARHGRRSRRPRRPRPERGDHRMRWFVCARSRFAEQVLADAVAAGVDQLVVLGAGLDTFAYRSPYDGLRVVEVDHPATRPGSSSDCAGRRDRGAGPVVHAAVDFERQDLRAAARTRPWPSTGRCCFWWLGVTPLPHRAGRRGDARPAGLAALVGRRPRPCDAARRRRGSRPR